LLLVYLVFYGIPSVGGFKYSPTLSFIITLSIYSAAYLVEIFRSGTLKGDIYTADIMIEGGAEFQGYCHMASGAGGAEKAARPGNGKEAVTPAERARTADSARA